jgi:N-acetylmuramoyl-L-alanine amidase
MTGRTRAATGRAWAAALLLLLAALGSARDAAAVQRPAAPAQVERVRYEATGTSLRVMVLLSRKVPYEVSVLAGDPARGSGRRLVIDFSNAKLGPGAGTPIGVEDGLLQRIRTGQFTARTARVVLDLADVSTHSVSQQDNPPRVVIDIRGTPRGEPQRPIASAPAEAEPPAAARVEAKPEPSAKKATDLRGQPAADVGRGSTTEARRESRDSLEALGAPPAGEPGKASPTPAPRERPDGGARAVEPPVTVARAEAPAPPPPVSQAQRAEAAVAAESETAAAKPDASRPAWRIVLDPGHGGKDTGALGVDGVYEKDVTLTISRKLAKRLREGLKATVLLTRDGDATRSLAERTAFANANSADLFISIHANADQAGELHGIETYTLNNSNDRATIRLAKMENGPGLRVGKGDLSFILSDMVQSGKEEESNVLAERLHSRILSRIRTKYPDVRNLGVKKGPFYVLVGAYMPCVLVETSFLSHPIEGRRLASPEYQTEIVEGMYLGINDFLSDTRLAKTL